MKSPIAVVVLAAQGPSPAVVAVVTPVNVARPPLTAAELKHYESGHLR